MIRGPCKTPVLIAFRSSIVGQIAKRSEYTIHVCASNAQPFQCLTRRGSESLPSEICSIHSEVNMSVDESRAHGPIRQVDYFRCRRPIDGPPNTRDAIRLNRDLYRSAQRIGQAVEHFAARVGQCYSSLIIPFPLPRPNEPDATSGDEFRHLREPEPAIRHFADLA
jgi:hypothetical protein